MKYQKIMLISKNEISSWESCKHITNNLALSYLRGLSSSVVETLKVPEDLSLFEAFVEAKKIKEKNFDLVVWLDHKPNAAIMLEALNVVFDGADMDRKPKFLIHLFGDFVLDCLGWESAFLALKNYPVHFIAASGRQKKIVDSFFISEKSLCSVMPFAVDEKVFNVEGLVDNRKIYREKFKAHDDFVILYTGRISYQKNVDALIKIVESLKDFSARNIQLWIAGGWDDIILPYAGINGVAGSYFTQFNIGFPLGIDLRVKFLGQLKALELACVYQSADLFMSLSTFNDEDYGMSVAEALCSGLPCLLSDWGGFESFSRYSSVVDLVKVSVNGDGPSVDKQEARKKLMKMLLVEENNLEKREFHSKKSLEFLSVEASASNLRDLLDKVTFDTLDEFSCLFKKVCESFRINKIAPFESEEEKFSEVYREIYTHYVS